MKYYIDGVLVVEGTGDSAYLSSFIDCLYVETNGYDLPKEEIDFLNHIPSNKKIIILTDSDDAGINIRKAINNKIGGAINVSVDVRYCNKNNKHGIAECEKNELINVLKEHFVKNNNKDNNITVADIQQCGVINKETRNYACNKFHLGRCNNKTFIKRFCFMNYQLEDLKKIMEGYHGNK